LSRKFKAFFQSDYLIETLLVTAKSFSFSYDFNAFFFILALDDRKMDRLIQETERSREMVNQIASKTFTTHAPDQGMLPTGQEVSPKYTSTFKKMVILFNHF